jgi:hypothetical protein
LGVESARAPLCVVAAYFKRCERRLSAFSASEDSSKRARNQQRQAHSPTRRPFLGLDPIAAHDVRSKGN